MEKRPTLEERNNPDSRVGLLSFVNPRLSPELFLTISTSICSYSLILCK